MKDQIILTMGARDEEQNNHHSDPVVFWRTFGETRNQSKLPQLEMEKSLWDFTRRNKIGRRKIAMLIIIKVN
jgi:hypothetical protein